MKLRIWRSFSSNTSGSDTLVGRFATVEEADRVGVALAALFAEVEALLRLSEETSMAVHCTTNGIALADGDLLEVLEACLGELRLSLHPDDGWRSRGDWLVRSTLNSGVNLLVVPASLPTLEATPLELLDRGCDDALLLRYIGSDPALALDLDATRDLERRVAAVDRLLGGALRLKLSVCWGDLLGGGPRTHVGLPVEPGADCGAGRDQVVITADRRMKPCSFHHHSVPIRTAADVLRTWRAWEGQARVTAGQHGCGRSVGA